MAAAAVAVLPDLIAPNSPADAVSSLHFAPRGPGSSVDYLCASSWDCSVSVWEAGANGDCVPRAHSAHGAPVLCTAWSADASSIISGGCDNSVRLWQVATNQSMEIGKHDAPVRCVFDLSAAGTAAPSIASLSWDKSCRYWDARSAAPGAAAALTVPLADKAYAADAQGVVLAVACAERHVQIFDLRRPDAPVQSMASPLKFQSRAIALFPDQTGFALGSIEGRVSIQYISDPPAAAQPPAGGEPQPDPRNFAFKCTFDAAHCSAGRQQSCVGGCCHVLEATVEAQHLFFPCACVCPVSDCSFFLFVQATVRATKSFRSTASASTRTAPSPRWEATESTRPGTRTRSSV